MTRGLLALSAVFTPKIEGVMGIRYVMTKDKEYIIMYVKDSATIDRVKEKLGNLSHHSFIVLDNPINQMIYCMEFGVGSLIEKIKKEYELLTILGTLGFP